MKKAKKRSGKKTQRYQDDYYNPDSDDEEDQLKSGKIRNSKKFSSLQPPQKPKKAKPPYPMPSGKSLTTKQLRQ